MEVKIYEAASGNDVAYVREALVGKHGTLLTEDVELALLRAAANGHKECVTLLLENMVSVHAKDGAEDTALILASQSGHVDVVRKLLEYGSPVNYQNSHGLTSLMKSCENGHLQVAELLLENGANEGNHVTDCHLENVGHISPRPVLRKDIPRGYTSLMVTVLKQADGYKEMIKLLLKANVPVDEKDLEECTVLHHAAKRCNADVLEILLDAKADINAQDVWGVTPLMNAAAYSMADNVNTLLKRGADVSVICKAKRCALSVAVRTAGEEIINTLISAGADLNYMDAHAKAPLFIAMVHRNYAAMKCLIQAGCNLQTFCRDMSTWQMMTAFQYAVSQKDLQMIDILYRAGACTNQSLYKCYVIEKSKSLGTNKTDVLENLKLLTSEPRSLKSCCRNVIRDNINRPLAVSVHSISLPKYLTDYLLFSDITYY